MDLPLQAGWIEVICGCMYAGKTEELLRRVRRIQYAKKEVVLFKPKIDNRYSEEAVVSHNKNQLKSVSISKSSEIFKHITQNTYAVAIDEVQFFDNDIVGVCNSLANSGIRVIVAGLDCDFRGEPFGPVPELLARAEDITKLSAICQVCGAPATRTQRIINGVPAKYSDPVILVGATESYEARCRHHHIVK